MNHVGMTSILAAHRIMVDEMFVPGEAGSVCMTTQLSGKNATGAPVVHVDTGNMWLSADTPTGQRYDNASGNPTLMVSMDTPVGQRREFDGAIPPGRSILRGRPRRRVLEVPRTPASSPHMEIEFEDVIPSIP